MFYTNVPDGALRFGDVLSGYFSTTPVIDRPNIKGSARNYNINVVSPAFCAVMDPCCQIGHGLISLSPLTKVRSSFFDNPYFEKDLTNINRKIDPQQAVSLAIWEGFPDEEKMKRLQVGKTYAFVNLFVYARHDLLPSYVVNRKKGNIETNYYMVDFRNIYNVHCLAVESSEKAPLESKVLQLSLEARSQLRDKISFYYAQIPEEDRSENW